MRDERGHQWATILGAKPTDTRFPLVCSRCMCRDDSVWAESECDG